MLVIVCLLMLIIILGVFLLMMYINKYITENRKSMEKMQSRKYI